MEKQFREGVLKLCFAVISFCLLAIQTHGQSLQDSMVRGKQIYTNECMTCHMENGEGIAGAFPPLANSDYFQNDVSKAVVAILNGLEGELEVNEMTYYGVMDPVSLSDQEVADVLNYIRNSWGGKAEELKAAEIQAMKKKSQ
ncbi:MAG: cytochrome c [Reichenbachiella sp.]|uniref:c-type cytochrome n=1 Tax=Reichenbachiella sp. TaxID=2184521 RepID=UPI0032989A02